ncbi:MAG: hemerythrin domain-containing protein [Burkholderiales bacterium]
MEKRMPLTLAAASLPSARDAVIGTIHEEHRTLRTVLAILQRLLHDSRDYAAEPDFGLLCTALYYIDDFPERVHHPKEDRYLFAAMRRRTDRFDSVLERLRGEHARSPQMLRNIQRELVHYQGGAPDGLKKLSDAVQSYAAMLHEHMKSEEALLAAAGAYLTEEDWSLINHAFACHGDPLLPDADRQEFRRLKTRILTLLPRKMRLDTDSAQSMLALEVKGHVE